MKIPFAFLRFKQDSFETKSTPVKDPSVKAYHTFNDMRFFKFPLANGSIAQSCPAALGYAFAAGTTDWPGPLDFTQGNNNSMSQNPFWAIVSGVVSTPTPEQKAVCPLQWPKNQTFRSCTDDNSVTLPNQSFLT